MNDEIKISEQAREAADAINRKVDKWIQAFQPTHEIEAIIQRYADEQVMSVDTTRRAFIAELESVLAQRDQQVNQLIEVGKALNEVLDFKTKTIEEMNVERQRLAACVKERDQRIAELEAVLHSAINELERVDNVIVGHPLVSHGLLHNLRAALGEKTV